MNTVLLTNAQLRKTLAAVRTLGSKRIPTYVTETTRFNPSAYSRYCSGFFLSPNPNNDKLKYAEWLATTLIDKKIKILIPMDDDTMDAVIEHSNLFNPSTLSILPPKTSYEAASDKGISVSYAAAAGVSTPLTFTPKNFEELESIAERCSYPVVIKPRHSSGSRGICVVGSKDTLLQQYVETHDRYPLPILQEFISRGDRYDVCLLYDRDGILKASFVQKEIRHFPLERGPSTLQESVHRPDLIELAVSIMKNLPWIGIVEIEFMVDPRDGIPKFMEINPRFWNSLHTSILAGVDFPYLLYRLACGDVVDNVYQYKIGVRCRCLLPGDILHYLTNPLRHNIEPAFWTGSVKGGKDDILSWQDPLPTLGFLLACLRYLPDPNAWKFVFNRS